eukprot:2540519-Prymnesium_polylepis.1
MGAGAGSPPEVVPRARGAQADGGGDAQDEGRGGAVPRDPRPLREGVWPRARVAALLADLRLAVRHDRGGAPDHPPHVAPRLVALCTPAADANPRLPLICCDANTHSLCFAATRAPAAS